MIMESAQEPLAFRCSLPCTSAINAAGIDEQRKHQGKAVGRGDQGGCAPVQHHIKNQYRATHDQKSNQPQHHPDIPEPRRHQTALHSQPKQFAMHRYGDQHQRGRPGCQNHQAQVEHPSKRIELSEPLLEGQCQQIASDDMGACLHDTQFLQQIVPFAVPLLIAGLSAPVASIRP